MGDPAAEKPPEYLAATDGTKLARALHDAFAIPPQAQVEVAARTGLGRVEFGHEGDAHPQPVGDFLEALFEDDVAVGHVERVAVPQVQFVLPLAPFTLGTFHRDARLGEVAPHGPVQGFLARALQDVVILQVPSGRLEGGSALRPPRVPGEHK